MVAKVMAASNLKFAIRSFTSSTETFPSQNDDKKCTRHRGDSASDDNDYNVRRYISQTSNENEHTFSAGYFGCRGYRTFTQLQDLSTINRFISFAAALRTAPLHVAGATHDCGSYEAHGALSPIARR